jgi:hypothetical protein
MMIHKSMVETHEGTVARVTFTLPASLWADPIYLVGEFNAWNATSHPFRQDRLGTWTLSLDLAPHRVYSFCYLCAGQWVTDAQADGYLWDGSGKHLFLVQTEPASAPLLEALPAPVYEPAPATLSELAS